jgi:hypothetical protein
MNKPLKETEEYFDSSPFIDYGGYVIRALQHPVMGHYMGYIKLPKDFPLLPLKRRWFAMPTLAWMDWQRDNIGKPKKERKPFTGKKHESRRYVRYNYEAIDVDVNGGLTFSEFVNENNYKDFPQNFSCGWWIGWDYAHAWNVSPGMEKYMTNTETYKAIYGNAHFATKEEVLKEAKHAVRQLKAYARKHRK